MLAIVHNGIAIPVLWDVLDRAGNSTTAHREALLSRFCAVFGAGAIAGLIADREFVGTAWMTFLAENDIPFILRIKDAFQIRLADGRCCAVTSLFRKLTVGGRRYLRDDCRLGSRDSALGPPVKLSATRLASKDLLVVATNTDPKTALAHYRRRWEIETLFAATKTRGLNLEDTHITRPDRVAKLSAVLAIAFSVITHPQAGAGFLLPHQQVTAEFSGSCRYGNCGGSTSARCGRSAPNLLNYMFLLP